MRLLSFARAHQDPIERTLSETARQGTGRAHIAHVFAGLLLILFSAASVVVFGSDALGHITSQWAARHTAAIPDCIVVAVAFLLVLAMDYAMIQASGQLRVLLSRRASAGDKWVHVVIIASAVLLEAGTYLLMCAIYERPAGLVAWAFLGLRAVAAPLYAVYLSMARPLPVTASDMLALAELLTGAALLRDIATAADDHTLPLAGKMRLYLASATMKPHDRERLQNMILAVEENTRLSGRIIQASPDGRPVGHPTGLYDGQGSHQLPTVDVRTLALAAPGANPTQPDRSPTESGTPSVLPVRTTPKKTPAPGTIQLVPDTRPRRVAPRGRRHPKESVEAKVRAAYVRGMSVGELAAAANVSRSSANRWRIVLERERQQSQVAQ